MCGLAGIYHLEGAPVDSQILLRMSRMIRHRGPDDEGFLLINTQNGDVNHYSHDDTLDEVRQKIPRLPNITNANLGLAYRRLSIIDVTASGHQPMSDPGKNVWLNFNGEIYNYLEIKSELISLSHKFITNSDSEVIIHAYLEWGSACLQKFIGMFSFIIYDSRQLSLFIARDRLGVKPLNYYYDGKKFIWASEEKVIAKSGLVPVSPNASKIVEFLSDNRYFEDDDTFFNEIKQLPAGHFAVVNKKGIEIQKYWDIKIPHPDELMTESQSINSIQELLMDSVRLRLRSDVPLGIALSGGIDSSTVACLAKKLSPNTLQTFSVYYEGKKYDERKYIQAILDNGGYNATFYTANETLDTDEIKKWIYQQDAPSTGGSPFSAYQNYKNVRKAGITVLLNGQGGDELFAGYPYYYKYYFAELIKQNAWKEFSKNVLQLLLSQGLKTTAAHVYLAHKVLRVDKTSLRKLEYKKYSTPGFYPTTNLNLHAYDSGSPTNTVFYNAVRYTHLPHMLRWEDRNSMAHSIESRVPFLDHRLVELSFRIPVSSKLKNGITKNILRQSMRGIVPDIVLDRKDKIGFGTPTGQWTQQRLATLIRDTIFSKDFEHKPWWFAENIRRQYEKNPQAFGENELWRILTCESWYQIFFTSQADFISK